MRIRTKFLLFVEGMVAAGVIALGATVYHTASAALEVEAEGRLMQAADLVATQAERAFSTLVKGAELWAQLPLVLDTAHDYENPTQRDAFNRYFRFVCDDVAVFQSINLVNLDADCVASSNVGGGRLYNEQHRNAVRERVDFLAALEGRTGVTGSIVSRGTGRPCMAISAPIQEDGKVVAVFRLVVDLEMFNQKYLAPLHLGRAGRLVVIDPELDLFLVGNGVLTEPIAMRRYELPLVNIPASQRDMKAGHFRYAAEDGIRLAAFRGLERPAWVFVAEQPLSEVLAPIHRLRRITVAVTAGLLVVIGTGLFLIARPALHSLRLCQQFARDIQQGRLEERLAIRRKDELGLLAENLNEMATGLVQQQSERETAREAIMRGREAERLLADARWQALRYQVNPHFLFNVLNSLEALSRTAPERIPCLIEHLSDYLRLTLDAPGTPLVSLRSELAALRAYLSIEKVRYESKLDVVFDCEPGAEDWEIPDLLLQPLVENAIKYGMRTSPLPLRLKIRAFVKGGLLCIQVENSGTWVDETADEKDAGGGGIGLDNLQQRLALAYGDRVHFLIRRSDESVTVELELPKLSGGETRCP